MLTVISAEATPDSRPDILWKSDTSSAWNLVHTPLKLHSQTLKLDGEWGPTCLTRHSLGGNRRCVFFMCFEGAENGVGQRVGARDWSNSKRLLRRMLPQT